MTTLKLYEVSDYYINYLSSFDRYVAQNKEQTRKFVRKYIGILLEINDMYYIAPFSSFKTKHSNMKDTLDFIKLEPYAVINLNNMIPVPKSELIYININEEKDEKYKQLLRNEINSCQSKQKIILSNAQRLYDKVVNYNSYLSKRCCDFKLLEIKCQEYIKQQILAQAEVAVTSER